MPVWCSDGEDEFNQKCKWRMKVSAHFYLDREQTKEVFKLTTKAKGKARREIKFETFTDSEGNQKAQAFVTQTVIVKKMVYKLQPHGSSVRGPVMRVVSICGLQ